MKHQSLWLAFICVLICAAGTVADAPQKLQPGKTLTIAFPEMPRTFYNLTTTDSRQPAMTVFLPTNYDPQRKYPLLVFLQGGNGGGGGNPGIALTQERDFICVNLPLWKVNIKDMVIRDEDCKLMWPLHKQMLAKLSEIVPNIDTSHRVLGGFSNGAHATGGLIDCSNGEVARYFSGFFFVEGGGRTQRYDLIKGKPLLICYGYQPKREAARTRVAEFSKVASDAGAKVTVHEMPNTGHDFPNREYPFVLQWLRGVCGLK